MLIDCDTCVMRHRACGDCVMSVILGAPPEGVVVDDDELGALELLAESGLVPRLRLVPLSPGGSPGGQEAVASHAEKAG